VGNGASDTSTVTATNDNLSGDLVGVLNLENSISVNATLDWWGSSTGPTTTANPGGTGSGLAGKVSFSPWLGDVNLSPVDYLVFAITTGNLYVVTPNSGKTILNVTLGGNPVGSIAGGNKLGFAGNGGTATINGESGSASTDVFTITDTSVQFNATDGLAGSTINFLGTGMSRNVNAQGTINTFKIQGAGASGPSGNLVGDSGTNAFVLGATGKVFGNIQGAGSSTINDSAYSSGVTVNLATGTATGVTGSVSGITAVIGSNFNDTLIGNGTGVALTGGLGTNTLKGSGSDTVVESGSTSYTLTNSALTGSSPSFTDNLTGLTLATLTGGPGGDSFTVSGWTGNANLIGGNPGTGHVNTVVDAEGSTVTSFTLANSVLTATPSSGPSQTFSLANVTNANLSSTSATFTVSGWTGTGALSGTTINASKAGGTFTLSNTGLTTSDGMNLTLTSVTTANLTDTAGGATVNVSGWTNRGKLTNSGSSPDTLTASKNAGFTLTNTSLSSTDGMSLTLAGNFTPSLTDTGSGHTFTVTGWTGKGSLTGTGETVAASESSNVTLTNSALTAGTMSLGLAGFTKANLTVTSTSSASYTLDGSAFTGTESLSATGMVSANLLAGTGTDTLTTTSSGNSILIGNGANITLTDTGTGYNILIGAGPGGDTITGNGSDILIGGTTTYDKNLAALDAVLAEWDSSDSYSTRINKIMSGITVGSSTYALKASTVTPDSSANTVKDGSGSTQNNWFIVGPSDHVTKKANETETTI